MQNDDNTHLCGLGWEKCSEDEKNNASVKIVRSGNVQHISKKYRNTTLQVLISDSQQNW